MSKTALSKKAGSKATYIVRVLHYNNNKHMVVYEEKRSVRIHSKIANGWHHFKESKGNTLFSL